MLLVTLADLSLNAFQLVLILSLIGLFTWIVTELVYHSEMKEMKREFELWMKENDNKTNHWVLEPGPKWEGLEQNLSDKWG